MFVGWSLINSSVRNCLGLTIAVVLFGLTAAGMGGVVALAEKISRFPFVSPEISETSWEISRMLESAPESFDVIDSPEHMERSGVIGRTLSSVSEPDPFDIVGHTHVCVPAHAPWPSVSELWGGVGG